jgi:Protein of unknown function (DUF1064)
MVEDRAMNPDRDSWTEYAKRNGFLQPARPEQLEPARAAAVAPRNKYGARRTQVNGIWFDSMKEANRYQELIQLERAGAIAELELQPVFPLHVMELYRSLVPIRITTVGRFTADFRYCDRVSGEIVVEDTKSEATKTEAYRLRKRLAEVIHGIHVREL